MRCYLFGKMDQLIQVIRKLIPKEMNLGDSTVQLLNNYLGKPFTWAVCTFDYEIMDFSLVFTREFHRR